MADDWIAAGDYYNPNPIGAGGILSSSGHGWFAPSGTTVSGDNPNAIVPGYAAADNYTSTGASSQGLTAALGALSKSFNAAQGSQNKGTPLQGVSPGQAPIGAPRNATNLSTLLQMLAQRREGLLNSATGGVGAGAVPQQPRVQGLLGF